jgi:hypothetical protein
VNRLILVAGCLLASTLVGAYCLLLHQGRSPNLLEVFDERIHARTVHGDHSQAFVGFWIKEANARALIFLEDGGRMRRAGGGISFWHTDTDFLYFDDFPSCGNGAPSGSFSSKGRVSWIDDDTFELVSKMSNDTDTYRRVDALTEEFRRATVEQFGLGPEEESYRAFWIIEVMADMGHWDRDQMQKEAADLASDATNAKT